MPAINESIHKAKYEYPYMDIGYNFDDYFLHFHPETEVLYVYEGSIVAVIDSENRILTQGDICIILPNQIHTLIPIGHIKIHVMKLYPLTNLINIQLEKNIYKNDDEHYDYLFQNITTMITEDTEKKTGFELAVVNSAGNIMLYILRNLPQKRKLDITPKKLMHYTNFIENINSYLEENYNTDFSLEDIAFHFHYSKSYFSRLFKEITGTNFRDYLTLFRLKKSVHLLKETPISIENVAFSSGFNNSRSYIRSFLKHYEQSPGSYRKNFLINRKS